MSNDIDGIFISIHKFVGGPESPGLLICKKTIFGSKTPVFLTKSSLLYQTDET